MASLILAQKMQVCVTLSLKNATKRINARSDPLGSSLGFLWARLKTVSDPPDICSVKKQPRQVAGLLCQCQNGQINQFLSAQRRSRSAATQCFGHHCGRDHKAAAQPYPLHLRIHTKAELSKRRLCEINLKTRHTLSYMPIKIV